jgi:hypothetical protein
MEFRITAFIDSVHRPDAQSPGCYALLSVPFTVYLFLSKKIEEASSLETSANFYYILWRHNLEIDREG